MGIRNNKMKYILFNAHKSLESGISYPHVHSFASNWQQIFFMINAEEEKRPQNHFHDKIFKRNVSDPGVNLRNTRKTMQTCFK